MGSGVGCEGPFGASLLAAGFISGESVLYSFNRYRILNPVSNFAVFLPDCRKRSNAFSTLPHRLDHLCKRSALLGRLAGRFFSLRPAACLRPIWTTDFLESAVFRLAVLLRASRSRFPCSTVVVSLSSLFSLALTTQGARTRSFACS